MKIKYLNLKIIALILAVIAYFFPAWTTHLSAPFFGKGTTYKIHVTFLAYVDADPQAIQNLNIGHQYAGLPPLEPDKMIEVKLTPLIPAVIIVAIVLNIMGKIKGKWVLVIGVLVLGGFVGYFQYWLYKLGHSMSPDAPVKMQPFTPILMGAYTVANVTAFNYLDVGFWLLLVASILPYIAERRK